MDKISELRKLINQNAENELSALGHLSNANFVAKILELEKHLCALYDM